MGDRSNAVNTSSGDRRTGCLLGGKWQVEEVLGGGATSTVYAATHRDGRRGAIKVLRSYLAPHREVVDLFFSEGYLVSSIEHPGVVKVLDDGYTDDGCPYLVLELLIGQTLDDLRQARGGRIPLDEVMPIADAMMDTLAAVHEVGVVHRDLKPQNVMVLDGGGVKLLDFGLAKLRGHTAYAAQGIIGTPSFMPPEQALGLPKKMDAQSDVWSLGASLFYALSGQPVHVAKHSRAMVLASASTRPRSLSEAAPELPIAIVEVIDRALSFRKADRWPSVEAMRSAWHDAHPTWLPTLQVPKYSPDPAFLQAQLVETHPSSGPKIRNARASMEEITTSLFDPRKLTLDPSFQQGAFPGERAGGTGTAPTAAVTRTPPPPLSRRSRWREHLHHIAIATTAILTTSLVAAAIALSRGERPATPRPSSHAPVEHHIVR